MKTSIIVSSAINVNNDNPLTYSKTRTFFSPEERLRQTIFTVNSLWLATDPATTTIWVVDNSENWGDYIKHFYHYGNVRFNSMFYEFPEIHNEINTHPNKTRCESLLMSSFLRKYKQTLSEYDYIFKMSGRYFVDRTFDLSIIENNPDKIIYKKPIEFEWDNSWGYELVDQRKEQDNNKLYQYCSVLFGWGKKYQQYFLDMYTSLAYILNQPKMHHYDIETLGYFFSREFKEDIVEVDWKVNGWDGTSGRFVRY